VHPCETPTSTMVRGAAVSVEPCGVASTRATVYALGHEFQCRGTKTMVNHRKILEIIRNPGNRERRADHSGLITLKGFASNRSSWFATRRSAVRSRSSPLVAQRIRSDNVTPALSAAQVQALRLESDARTPIVYCVICVIASYRSKPTRQARSGAHHDRHCVICVICVIASHRSKPTRQPRCDAHLHRNRVICVICVIASYRAKPIRQPRSDARTIKDRV
jgi:hypothetical protein